MKKIEVGEVRANVAEIQSRLDLLGARLEGMQDERRTYLLGVLTTLKYVKAAVETLIAAFRTEFPAHSSRFLDSAHTMLDAASKAIDDLVELVGKIE